MSRSAVRRTAVALALLFAAVPQGAHAQARWSASGSAAFVEHRVRNGGPVEARSGPLAGFHAGMAVAWWVGLDAYVLGGRLKAETPATYNERLTELGAGITVAALPWLALRAGASRRSYVATFGGQRWTAIPLDAEARVPLLGGDLHGVMQARLMPLVWVSGIPARPNLAIGARTGLEWARRGLTAGLSYTVERYQFPTSGGVTRAEQLSSINLRFGLRLVTVRPAGLRRGPSK